ncbi:MAG: hypothetical protein ACOCXQ_00655 [Patescibacteria group bacterium]
MIDRVFFTRNDPVAILRLEKYLEPDDIVIIRTALISEIGKRLRNILPAEELRKVMIMLIEDSQSKKMPILSPKMEQCIAEVHADFIRAYTEELCQGSSPPPSELMHLHDQLGKSSVNANVVSQAINMLYAHVYHHE